MKLNAVAVVSSNVSKTVAFYELLGFKFQDFTSEDQHVETVPVENMPKLMIDSKILIKELIGETPKPGNTSGFAILYDSPKDVDEVAEKILKSGYKIVKEPWDAFWGQRYAVVEDPDGYKSDLYAYL